MKRLRAQDEVAAQLSAVAAAYGFKVTIDEIVGDGRGSGEVAFARQVAMYLCHIAFEMSLARVAVAFGRDRSTVAHACHIIEDRREDAAFDGLLTALEAMLREAPSPTGRNPLLAAQ